MSGIAAILHTDGRPVEPGMIERMTAAMSYRGPDAISHWSSGPVAIGHCLLQTTAGDQPGMQPLANEDDSVVLAMDGYLANFEELRSELLARQVKLRSDADAELVLRAYETWGKECPRHIDGEYALIVRDEHDAGLFCARDHVGLRPLHYHWDGTTLLVATDIAGILAALPQTPGIDRQFLAEVMANTWISRDRTPWASISRLLPAHALECRNGCLHVREYWQLPTMVTINYRRDEEYTEHYRELLTRSVTRAARTSYPLACEVSGGLDSTAIFSLALGLQHDQELPAPSLHGYTFLPPQGSDADELDYVADLEALLDVELQRVPLFMPPLEWYRQQSMQDRDLASYPNTAMVVTLGEKLVADGCRVALNGQGGDLWLSGSPRAYHEELAAGRLHHLARLLDADRRATGLGPALRSVAHHGIRHALPRRLRTALRGLRKSSAEDAREAPYWLAADLRADLESRRDEAQRAVDSNPAGYKFVKLQHPLYLRLFDSFTRQAARLGYEPRSPMLSREFIEFSATTPERIRMRGGITKIVHRRALTGRIPESIRQRTTKAEFSFIFDALAKDTGNCLKDGEFQDNFDLIDRDGLKLFAQKYCTATIDSGKTWELFGLITSYLFAIQANVTGVPEDDERQNDFRQQG